MPQLGHPGTRGFQGGRRVNGDFIRETTTGSDGSSSGDSNYGRYSNPKMDRLIQTIKTEFNMQKRNAAIRDAMMLATADLPVLPLHQPLIPWAMRKNVTAVTAPSNIAYIYRFSVK